MSGLPNFPVNGSIISSSVTNDRISLVTNDVGNQFFPQGQYIFFTKNSSIWYKYKTASTPWTNEFLWISNASQSNTKFDANGYPITAYVRSDGSININRYDANGNFLTNTVAITGYLPTVAINSFDTYIFFVPPNFTNKILYTDISNNFSIIHNYVVPAPGQIDAMQIELVSNNRFLFTFEVDTPSTQKVYIAFTDPAVMLITYDVQAFISFTQGNFFGEELNIAHLKEKFDVNLGVVGAQNLQDKFTIADKVPNINYVLVRNEFTLGPEYFVLSEKSDLEIAALVVFSESFNESIALKEPNVGFGLTFAPQAKGNTKEYFVLKDVSVTQDMSLTQIKTDLNLENLYISDKNNVQTNLSGTSVDESGLNNLQSELLFSDKDAPIFVFANYTPFIPPKNAEYFVFFDDNDNNSHCYSFNLEKTFDLKYKESFDISDVKSLSYIFSNHEPSDVKFKELISIHDKIPVFELFQIINLHDSEFLNIEDSNLSINTTLFTHSNSYKESLKLKEKDIIFIFNQILNFSDFEQLYINVISSSIALSEALASIPHIFENLYIGEKTPSTTFHNVIQQFLPEDAGSYSYEVPRPQLNGIPLIAFTSNNQTVPSYYYFLDSSFEKNYKGPLHYNVVVNEFPVSYKLNSII